MASFLDDATSTTRGERGLFVIDPSKSALFRSDRELSPYIQFEFEPEVEVTQVRIKLITAKNCQSLAFNSKCTGNSFSCEGADLGTTCGVRAQVAKQNESCSGQSLQPVVSECRHMLNSLISMQ